MRLALALSAFFLAAAVNLALWYWPNRPLPVDHPWPGGRIESFSFAPFHDELSPLTHRYPSPAEIEADLKALRGWTRSIRTYSNSEGLGVVPALAQKYGIEVIEGAWLGVELPINEAEVATLIELANRYPDTIKRVIVGNEVLLRNDLTPAQLAAYIRRVKAAVKQPVSYADVWEFWLKHPEIAQEVDFVTIHLLPYWEDQPTSVAEAQAHILATYRKLQAAFPGKPILIGEVGWPSAGRSREAAVPGRLEAAQFLNGFLNLAAAEHLDYNYVEAYDQPWKTELEGAMGGSWGLFTPSGQPKFPFAGPVEENPDWWMGAAASIPAAAAIVLWLSRRRPRLAPRQLAAAILLAQALSGMLAALGLHAVRFSYGPWQQVFGTLWFAWSAALAWLILADLLRRFAEPPALAARPARNVTAMLADAKVHAPLFLPQRRRKADVETVARFARSRRAWTGEWLLLAAAPLALYQTVMLDFDGRYRNFPVNEFLVPAFGFLLARLLAAVVAREPGGLCASFGIGRAFRLPRNAIGIGPSDARRERLVALALLASAVALVCLELPVNREADYWALMMAVLALPYAVSWLGNRTR